jgi:hypothetical protein
LLLLLPLGPRFFAGLNPNSRNSALCWPKMPWVWARTPNIVGTMSLRSCARSVRVACSQRA